jgi:sphingosine kinase
MTKILLSLPSNRWPLPPNAAAISPYSPNRISAASWPPECSSISFTSPDGPSYLHHESNNDSFIISSSPDLNDAASVVRASLKIEDVVGAQVTDAGVVLHSYPVSPASCCGSSDASARPRSYQPVTLSQTEAASTSATKLAALVAAVNSLCRPHPNRRLLVLINPFSGVKRGMTVFEEVLRPMLERSELQYTTLLTTHAGHAREHIAALDFSTVDGVITVSGDGLLFEVCQAFRARYDSGDIPPHFTFGIVAAGSGNGLASSLNHAIGRPLSSPIDNALSICKGRAQKLDLATCTTAAGNKYCSFLSLAWGIVADVDLESDVLRCLGPLRFDVYAVHRMISLKKYRARFSYTNEPKPTLNPVSQAVPESWTTIEDTFSCFWAVMTTHASDSIYASPNSTLDDGKFRVLLVRGDAGRFNLVKSFLAFENGSHLKQKWVDVIECTAYRIEPLSENSHMDLDGEEIEYGTVQVNVEPSATNIYL